MAQNTITIFDTSIGIKEYDGQRVITFKDIDAVHQRPEGTARKRFNDNRERFIEGEDYFVRKTDEAANEFGIIAPNGLVLITETGYLMLVKSFTDDLAWKVQRELVNAYFKVKMLAVSEAAITLLQNQVLALLPSPNFKKINTWKKRYITPTVRRIAEKYRMDERTAYDLVYDLMSAEYGFDRSCAMTEFYDKYRVEGYVTDAISDSENYRGQFFICANKLLNDERADNIKQAESLQTERLDYACSDSDTMRRIIQPLIIKSNDRSVNGARTYARVYSEMRSPRSWKVLMSRRHCKSIKSLISGDDKLLAEFRSVVAGLLENDTVM